MTETESLYLLLGLSAGVALVEFFWLLTKFA